MRWFKKKEIAKEELPGWWGEWLRIWNAFPIGRQFEYLGRKMIVSGYRHYRSGMRPSGYLPGWPVVLPAVLCEYSDDHGKLHEWEFPLGSWGVLPKEGL